MLLTFSTMFDHDWAVDWYASPIAIGQISYHTCWHQSHTFYQVFLSWPTDNRQPLCSWSILWGQLHSHWNMNTTSILTFAPPGICPLMFGIDSHVLKPSTLVEPNSRSPEPRTCLWWGLEALGMPTLPIADQTG
jgi:hypothetical protein